ncbi:MAG: AraC family transcriptional regulator [Lachnospiraceae bacterium]|nr:AraC family transcriptional regulator [Lachnospiraceae bacterium]
MDYTPINIEKVIDIESLITVHYFEYRSDFVFKGEHHDFWEFLYVDKGEVDVFNGTTWHVLKKGDIIFHAPGEFHSLRANGTIAPNLIVISFICNSPAMEYFVHRKTSCTSYQAGILANLIHEARNTFTCSLDDPFITKMTVISPDYGSMQLIKNYLEHFLLDQYRKNFIKKPEVYKPSSYHHEITDSEQLKKVITYLEENITKHPSVKEICQDNFISYSRLKQLFKQYYHTTILEYHNSMRITYAKELLRSTPLNISEIADKLGYNSIHYFSRQFKKQTGMSPTEYSSSVMLKSELSK